MRTFALLLSFAMPHAALAVPTTSSQRVHVSLINMSSQLRQVVVPDRVITLPVGRRVDIEANAGSTLHVVSDMDSRVDQRLRVPLTEEVRPIVVQ